MVLIAFTNDANVGSLYLDKTRKEKYTIDSSKIGLEKYEAKRFKAK